MKSNQNNNRIIQILEPSEVIRRFNDAFLRHDPSGLADLIAKNCVLENTGPAPDGSRHKGRAACLAVWQDIATTKGIRFATEDIVVTGDRAIIRWRLYWGKRKAQSVRGVNLMRMRNGLIVEAFGYIKGGD